MRLSDADREVVESHLAELHESSFAWAVRCCSGDRMDAEDVLQTAYAKVLAGSARYSGRSAFRTWFFGVIRFTAHEHLRRQRSLRERNERVGVELRLESDRGSTDPATAIHDRIEHQDRERPLREALATLPDRQQEILHLVFYEDLSVREAARVMGVSIGSARVHYDRAKRRLRARLEAKEDR